jgi:hypothetical protein
MANLSDLYTSTESAKVTQLQNAYDSLMNDLNHETTVNASAKASHNTVNTFGGQLWNNPNVYGGSNITPAQYQQWISQSDAKISLLTSQAAQAKIDRDDYIQFLNDKYMAAFNAAHPEVAAAIAQTTAEQQTATTLGLAQIAANAQQAQAAQAKGATDAAAADAAKKKNILIFSIIGGVVLIGIVIYFVKRKKD